MGTEDGGSAGDAVCQVDGCSLSIKWHATVINYQQANQSMRKTRH